MKQGLIYLIQWLWHTLRKPEPPYLPVRSGTTLRLKGIMPAFLIEVVDEDD